MEENFIIVGENNKAKVHSKVLNGHSFSEFIYNGINQQGDNVYVVSIGMLFSLSVFKRFLVFSFYKKRNLQNYNGI